MYAATNLSDALSVTGRYLRALGLRGWLKLGLVVLFIGGLGITSQLSNVPGELGFDLLENSGDPQEELWGVLLIAGLTVGVYGAFRYLAAVLEFVFVESLRSEALSLRTYMRANLGLGFWLLLFRVSLVIGALVPVAAVSGAIVMIGGVTELSAITGGQIAAIIITGIAALIGWWIVDTLTTAFVVPIMLGAHCGPISAWTRFGSSMASNWVGVLAFLCVAWVVGVILWVFLAIIGFFVTVFGLLGVVALGVALESVSASPEVFVFAVLLVGYVVYEYVVALIRAPVQSYVRYYALLLLGDTESSLDLIPEQRAAVRAPSSNLAEQTGASDETVSDGANVTTDRDADHSGDQWGHSYSHHGESSSESEWQWGDADGDGDDTGVDGHGEDTDDDDELRW